MENEAIENDKNSEWNPIIAYDEWRIENWIFEELNHALSGEEVAFSHKMLPAKYADKKKDGGYSEVSIKRPALLNVLFRIFTESLY